MRNIIKRKNRKVAVVACARKLAVLVWHVLSSGEPFRYGIPKTLAAKYARLRVRAQASGASGASPKARLVPLKTDKAEPERFPRCQKRWSKTACPRSRR
jgi:hypothetical protein